MIRGDSSGDRVRGHEASETFLSSSVGEMHERQFARAHAITLKGVGLTVHRAGGT